MRRPRTPAVVGLGALVLSALAVPATASTPAAPAAPAAAISPTVPVTDLDTSGEGYPVYRIPALTQTNAGTIIAAYDGRPSMADVPSNIALVIRRSTDNGETWEERQVVRYEEGKPGYGDPSIVVDRDTGRVWIFHAASINAGYFGSDTGSDNADPDILHADVSYSDDDGLTWQHRRLTHEAKDPSWGGIFAASGEGIQIRTGPYAGRLVQQYAIRYQGGNHAASLISDDHGETWRFGELVGPGMNENKVVELSDGRLMMNSRAPGGYRKVAYSEDGGETWSDPQQDDELIDPGNNGSIIRMNVDAAPQSPEADKLLFSNTATQSGRRNLTIKQSCDNGETWPIARTVDPGPAAYSTLTPLEDGSYGLLYERGGYQHISFARITKDWINGVCAPMTASGAEAAQAGETTEVKVTITSQETGAIDGGRITLELPDGWHSQTVDVPKIDRHEEVTVSVPVTVPEGVDTNAYPFTVHFSSDKGESVTTGDIVVEGGNLVFSDTTERIYDGETVTDLTGQVDAVKDLTGGAIKIRFTATDAPVVGTLVSLSDPISRVRDLVVSLNSGRPYIEVRTANSSYPVRLQSSVNVADGEVHELIAASNNGITSLILDGEVIAQVERQAFFSTITALTNPHALNPTGDPAFTLGANRAHFSEGGEPAAINERWGFVGTIHSVEVYDDFGSGEEAVPRSEMSVESVDSEETVGEDGRAVNAIDGNVSSIWHTHWSGGDVDPMPHQITLDLGASQELVGLRYLPRQDGGSNGDIAAYRLSVSSDGTSWTEVSAGTLSSSKGGDEVRFGPADGRYLRLEALSAHNGRPFAAAAELVPLRTR